MYKKISIFLIFILLVSCAKTKDEEIIDTPEYIKPINDVFLFDQINDTLKDTLYEANGDKNYENYQFKMLGKEIYKNELIDINDNKINLNDHNKIILEVLSIDCKHCEKFTSNYLNVLEDYDATIIQYFNVGTKQEIIDFYEKLNVDFSQDTIVIEHDDKLEEYLKHTLKLEAYPSFVCFYDNKVTFNAYGDMEKQSLDAMYNLAFENTINVESLIDKDGNDLLSLSRSIDDVIDDFSNENIEKLNHIDNDGLTKEYTYKLVGTKLDFDNITGSSSSVYISEIDDYTTYKNSNLVLIYTYLRDSGDIDKVEFINSLISSNDQYEYIVVLIEGLDSTSNVYRNMDIKFRCRVVSVLSNIPSDFFKLGISKYPTAFFVEKSTYVGAYSNIDSIDNFNYALDIFYGEDSIALIDNN